MVKMMVDLGRASGLATVRAVPRVRRVWTDHLTVLDGRRKGGLATSLPVSVCEDQKESRYRQDCSYSAGTPYHCVQG
jgi:hypothetical protein